MRFRVVGSEKTSGEGVDIEVEAPNQAWALRIAKQRGILVDSIDPAVPAQKPAVQPALPLKPPAAAPATKPAAPRPLPPKAATRNPVAPRSVPAKPPALDDPEAPLPLLDDVATDTPPARPPKQSPRASAVAEAPLLLTDDMAVDDAGAGAEPIGLAEPVDVVPPPLPPPPPPLPMAGPARSRSPAGARMPRLKLPAKIPAPLIGVGIFVLIMLALWGIWSFGNFGSAFPKYEKYIPDDAELIAFVDFSKVRNTDAYRDYSGRLSTFLQSAGSSFRVDDLDQILVCINRQTKEDSVSVVRTRNDRKLSELSTCEVAESKIDGLTWAKTKKGCVVQVDARTFCSCEDESKLKETLARAKRGSKPKLNEELRKALDTVSGHHIVIVGSMSGLGQPVPKMPRIFGVGASLGRTVTVNFIGLWADSSTPEQAVRAFDELKSRLSGADRREANKVKLSQSGNQLTMSARFDYADLKSGLAPAIAAAGSGGGTTPFSVPGLGTPGAPSPSPQPGNAQNTPSPSPFNARPPQPDNRPDLEAQRRALEAQAEQRRLQWEQEQKQRADQQRQQAEQRRRDREERQRQAQERLRQNMQRPGGG